MISTVADRAEYERTPIVHEMARILAWHFLLKRISAAQVRCACRLAQDIADHVIAEKRQNEAEWAEFQTRRGDEGWHECSRKDGV